MSLPVPFGSAPPANSRSRPLSSNVSLPASPFRMSVPLLPQMVSAPAPHGVGPGPVQFVALAEPMMVRCRCHEHDFDVVY